MADEQKQLDHEAPEEEVTLTPAPVSEQDEHETMRAAGFRKVRGAWRR
jgi:hypothetical protein